LGLLDYRHGAERDGKVDCSADCAKKERFAIGVDWRVAVLAPLAVEVHARVARIIWRRAIAWLSPLGGRLLRDAHASISVPSTVKGSSLVQLARLRRHGAEKLTRHIVLQQPRPIAAKTGILKERA
jgi:hypothetical protein